MKRKFAISPPPPANAPQRQPTPQQIDAAQRILSHDHQRTYGEGAKGATIRALQIYLASKGYEPGRFDGDWGAKTQAAFAQYNKDRGQSSARATPEVLASMSKEAGQSLPRQRPAQMADVPPPPVTQPPPLPSASPPAAPSPAQASPPAAVGPDPNEFGPERLHWDNLARDTTAAPPYQQPIISPNPDHYGTDMRELSAMQPPPPHPAPPAIPFSNPSRFNAASDPVVADDSIQQADLPGFASPHTSGGVPSDLMNAVAARRNHLRDALIGRDLLTGAPAGTPSRQAMLEALMMARTGR